ncbi:MAG: metallophosphoesterase family protein [Planctomycetes bacterium]|nr:metallophosphoesterase family protein [Planctomycetota bacterium]
MKALILSDIHSNKRALESILEAESACDVIYCAGDIVDVGPCPNEVIDMILQSSIHCVVGNHDTRVLDSFHNEDLSSIAADEKLWHQHNAQVLNEQSIEFLHALPQTLSFELDGLYYGMIHMYKNYDVILGAFAFDEFIDEHFSAASANEDKDKGAGVIDRLIFGHTHRQADCSIDQQRSWINPGSTAYRSYLEPANESKMAEYMCINDGQVEFKKCHYDYQAAANDIMACQGQLSQDEVDRACKRVIAI